MGKAMKNAPVFFTVAQVRYNPVLSLASYIPQIQEHFRKSGFPDFKKTGTMTLNLSPMLQEQKADVPAPVPFLVDRYSFSNDANTMNFLLEQSALAFQTTEYQTFDVFAGHLLQGLGLLHEAVGLSFIERIGVRYLDAVMPRGGEKLEQYLIPEVMSMWGKLKGRSQYSFSETLTEGEDGHVLSRTVIQEGRIGFPPDLAQLMTLKVAHRFEQYTGPNAIIDTDAFFTERIPFSLTVAKAKLRLLHDRTDNSFRATVTEHAIASWA